MIDIALKKKLDGAGGSFELDVALRIEKGEFVALSGTSGSGKTTLLRMLAGLEQPDSGDLSVNGTQWIGRHKHLKPQLRRVGYVFQDYALFPNMSVRENILYACGDEEKTAQMLELVELTELASHAPATLSGGQQQRVALARALSREPEILLLDEPLSALDPALRAKLQLELLAIHKELGITTIMVSHDMAEIFKLADRMVELHNGTLTRDIMVDDYFTSQHHSQKFAFTGEIVRFIKADLFTVACIAIGNRIVEVALSADEADAFTVGDTVLVGTKAFHPTLKRLPSEDA